MNKAVFFSLASLVFALTGCGKGQVAVKPADQPPLVGTPGSPSHEESASSSASRAGTLFFERAFVHAGKPVDVIGMAFLPSDSTSTDAFGFSVTSFKFDGGVRVAATSDGAVYARSTGSGDQLVLVKEASLESVATANTHVIEGVSASADGKSLAWTDRTGDAWIQQAAATDAATVRLDLQGDKARAVRFMPTSNEVWVESANRTFRFKAPSGELAGTIAGLSATQEPAGTRTAFLTNDPERPVLKIVGSAASDSKEISLQLQSAGDLSWISSSVVLYRGISASGAQELHQVDLSSGKELLLVQLLSPYFASGVNCPAVLDGKVYYSDLSESRYRIFRLDLSNATSRPQPQLFAQAREDEEGLICPSVSVGRRAHP